MRGDIGEIQLGSERELYKYINHYAVVKKKKKKRKKKYSKIILVHGEHYICTVTTGWVFDISLLCENSIKNNKKNVEAYPA